MCALLQTGWLGILLVSRNCSLCCPIVTCFDDYHQVGLHAEGVSRPLHMTNAPTRMKPACSIFGLPCICLCMHVDVRLWNTKDEVSCPVGMLLAWSSCASCSVLRQFGSSSTGIWAEVSIMFVSGSAGFCKNHAHHHNFIPSSPVRRWKVV